MSLRTVSVVTEEYLSQRQNWLLPTVEFEECFIVGWARRKMRGHHGHHISHWLHHSAEHAAYLKHGKAVLQQFLLKYRQYGWALQPNNDDAKQHYVEVFNTVRIGYHDIFRRQLGFLQGSFDELLFFDRIDRESQVLFDEFFSCVVVEPSVLVDAVA